MNQETLKIFNMSENDFEEAMEHYNKNGQILNRLVAMELGLAEY